MIHTKNLHRRLEKRGWEKQEIFKTRHILEKGETKKKKSIRRLDKALFWIILFVMCISNILVLIGMMPVLIQMPPYFSIIIFPIIGFCAGIFFDIAFRHTDASLMQYILAGTIIPAATTISMFLILNFVEDTIKEIGIFISANPLALVLIYLAGFMAPHIIYIVEENLENA